MPSFASAAASLVFAPTVLTDASRLGVPRRLMATLLAAAGAGPPGLGSGREDQLHGQRQREGEGEARESEARDGEPGGGDDADGDQRLDPVGDEKPQDLVDRGPDVPHAGTGLRMSTM